MWELDFQFEMRGGSGFNVRLLPVFIPWLG